MPHRRHLKRVVRQAGSLSVWRTRIAFWIGAALVGLAASALALASSWADARFHLWVKALPGLPLILTPLGLVAITWATRRLFPGGEGSGIPQAIAALQLAEHANRRAVLSLRIAVGKGIAIVLGLLCGASIGREGPTVHIAASIMYSLRGLANFPIHHVRKGLILAGGAAGLAAAFNTPLAGVMFAIEEMARTYEDRITGSLMIAVILAGMTALTIQGNYTYFGSYGVAMEPLQALGAVLACGVVGGLLGGLFSTLLIRGGRRLKPFRNSHPYLVAGACGLAVALIGLAAGGATWGSGYEAARGVLQGTTEAAPLYAPMKLLATLFSYLSGIPGGIFAPSLSVGAGIGYSLSALFPTTPMVAIGLLGMVGYFTGVVQTPVTAVIIVMEMTDDQRLLLPLMATALMAEAASRMVCHQPIYRALAQDFLVGNASRRGNSGRPSG